MKGEPIFGKNNPNHDIFIVESEEGATEEDTMSAMIGDATMRHLSGLTDYERQAWEHFVLMGNRNLFTFIESPSDTDQDTFNLKAEDIDNIDYKEHGPSHMKTVLEEAVENERERRSKSEDAYDRANQLIAFQDWQDNPGQFTNFDMPTTPKNLAFYCGNTNQIFYDEFPEGHPNADLINRLLSLLNREIDEITPKYIGFLRKWVDNNLFLPDPYKAINTLLDNLLNDDIDPEEAIKSCLTQIDHAWKNEYVRESLSKRDKDPVIQLILEKQQEWELSRKDGISVINEINEFGQILFSKFRKKMRKDHWDIYRKVKASFSPALVIKGLDINRCRLFDLERKLSISREKAQRIWFGRPYFSVDQLRKKGILEEEKFLEDSINPIIDLIKQRAQLVTSRKNMKVFSSLSAELVTRQKSGKDGFNMREWSSIWNYYRTTRDDILNSIKGK